MPQEVENPPIQIPLDNMLAFPISPVSTDAGAYMAILKGFWLGSWRKLPRYSTIIDAVPPPAGGNRASKVQIHRRKAYMSHPREVGLGSKDSKTQR